jgi:hypothetical protein
MGRLLWASMLVLLWTSPAAAQRVDRSGVPYRPWDIHGAVGFHTSDRSDGADRTEPFGDNWQPAWSVSFDVGHYWTSHLKTEAGLARLSQVEYYGQESIVGANGQQIGVTFSTTEAAQTQVVLAGTYQFLDNTFAHPYVSIGARVGLFDLHTYTTRYLYGSPATPYPAVPAPTEGRDRAVRVRPFVAIGSKSYFSERVFIRPEMLIAANGDGVSQFGLRLGVGFDF